MARGGEGWLDDLEAWSDPFLEALGHPARRHWAPYYLRGLLLPGERKSVQPTSIRLGLPAHDRPHNFVASPSWDGAPLEAVLAALRVHVADGEAIRTGVHLLGEEVWLVGERRASGETKYRLSNLPADASVERLAGPIKARRVCEQAHQPSR